jgi:hypothetical protein
MTGSILAHYADAFSVQPSQCFRFVHNGVEHAKHCPAPVTRHGTFVDGKGKRWEVDACDEHAEEATNAAID